MNENLTVKAQVDIPMSFDIKLEKWMLELKSSGVKISKAKLIINFAEIGFNVETKNDEK